MVERERFAGGMTLDELAVLKCAVSHRHYIELFCDYILTMSHKINAGENG